MASVPAIRTTHFYMTCSELVTKSSKVPKSMMEKIDILATHTKGLSLLYIFVNCKTQNI